MKELSDTWEAVIGLEMHVQLNTRSKLFSPAPNRFGDEPNTNISFVCTGQPRQPSCPQQSCARPSIWMRRGLSSMLVRDRKVYFYPDGHRLPVTQYRAYSYRW
jgi:aspartyl-tRNA(Asn)/glutamyl-tRNA(Gln) amidotransferase subunit B